ncbi:hypothetical protein BJX68DRAFT_278096 [Aspergillus pseudodeflectus]|uniref:BZIP domain-containing protein n=1 Tax=Aspergillus pseudodeflectus TaxID=176178 RepID=A0ABR4JTC6_9EURO
MATTTEVNPVIAERKERKRAQNRLNQRARRVRIRESTSEKSRSKGRPYRVDRWRLHLEEPASASASGVRVHASERWTTPVLPADHLLSLIQLNVSRGLRQNKTTLWASTFYYMPTLNSYCNTTSPPTPFLPATIHPDTLFYGSSLITSITNPASLPQTLIPTEPQMQLVHATWINILPFPRMRENLIRFEACFNHAEFLDDLVGGLVDTGRFFRGPAGLLGKDTRRTISGLHNDRETGPDVTVVDDDNDEVTSTRNGLIIWGEPYQAEAWEATPGFLRKWAWAVVGCDELIASTNRWRGLRGEGPVRGWGYRSCNFGMVFV